MSNLMEVSIFNEITTNEILVDLEAEAKKYEGLYVDMDNKEERKYVKDKAVLISSLLKTLDRARIDKSKDYKILVESEAANIKGRLEDANKPFTLLIDEHKEKRAKELAKIKEIEDRKALAEQIEADHDSAIMEDKVRTFEKAEAEKAAAELAEAQKAEVERLAKVAAELAAQELINKAELDKKEAEEAQAKAKLQAEEAERLRIEAVEQQKKDAILAEERRIEAVRQEEARRIEAAQKASQEADQAAEDARLAEIERQRQEALTAQKELEAREANKKHLSTINNVIVDVLVGNGFSKEDAKKFVVLAAKKQLPNLTINY